jgi:hypothetical protein
VSALLDEYLRQLQPRRSARGLELHREVRRLADRDWFMTVGLIEGRAAGIPVGITLGAFGTDSLQTPRWRDLDSNLRFRARAGSILPVGFVADSLLERAGFEPSVPGESGFDFAREVRARLFAGGERIRTFGSATRSHRRQRDFGVTPPDPAVSAGTPDRRPTTRSVCRGRQLLG